MRNKYPFYHQLDSMDCGPACLQMIAAYYKNSFDLLYLRELCYANKNGVSLLGISAAANFLGFKCKSVKVSFQKFQESAILPCIVFWRKRHFVVVYKISIKRKNKGLKGYIIVGDPAFGIIRYSVDEFIQGWQSDKSPENIEGIALLMVPSGDMINNLKSNKKSEYNIFYFLRYIRPYTKLLILIIGGMFVGLLVQMIFPFLTQTLVDVGIGDNSLNFILLILIAQIVLSFSLLLIEFIQNWVLLHVISRVNISLVADFITKILKLPISFFDSRNTGDILQRIKDHDRIRDFFTTTSINTFFSFFSFLVFAVILGYYNIYMLLFFGVGHCLYVLWVISFLKIRRKLDFRRFDEAAKNQSNIVQIVQGAEEIKLNGCEQKMRWKWENIQSELFAINVKGMTVEQTQNIGAFFITNIVNTTLLAYAAWLVVEGYITLGMMMSLSYITGQLKAPVQNFISFLHAYQDAKISLERLGEIHLKKNEDELNQGKEKQFYGKDQNIYLQNIIFSYNGLSVQPVLNNLNLKIEYNKVTAIVGESGSGKTTLLKLLLGYYRPQQGIIKIGDLDLQSINISRWRNRCGTVMQDGFIFSESIAENIGIKDEHIDEDRLKYAATLAKIDDFIQSLPEGYNTKIGQEGCGVSQGQKQRILIARAIYRDPEYVFFDEATNALDANNEKSVIGNLDNFFSGRTVIIVAHRLSTVKNADKIIVLKDGYIVEEGTHTMLIKRKGYYYDLVKNQLDQ